ncbi:MAG: rhomboid family intramembrane serine protease [Deltaproteobacteria bacterium]|nr:rhomboid family intramembrane serine protease [Deltaproteobacteria bacterium]MBW2218934.1 rhomboid family intramembrane serine protease [Deltaproteobacteria bacterium]
MLPIRDTTPSKNYPVVNNSIIGINIVFFLVQLAQGSGFDSYAYVYGLVPARYSIPHISSYFSTVQQLTSFVTFMFLHGGFWHLIGNMWSLYIFGDNVEDSLGHLRYLFFYLLCGMTSGFSHLLLNINSNVPTIGASGAIAGIMGAYLILHPRSKILTLIPIIFIPWFIEVPAFLFIGIWFAMQMLNAAGSHAASSGIAWWAHIGGFVFGILFLKLFLFYPDIGKSATIGQMTRKRRSHRMQVVRISGAGNDANLYGQIVITKYEVLTGTRKTVNIPWGFHNRLFKVVVPSGSREGNILRLKGLGRQLPDGDSGDLYLKIKVADTEGR